jgi:predicted amidohydrolase YtcJ
VRNAIDKYWTTNRQINLHRLCDAAADQALNSIEIAVRKYGMRDHRPVFIHAAYLRPDQLPRMKAVGTIPTFLTATLPKGGDSIAKRWGPTRSAFGKAENTFD